MLINASWEGVSMDEAGALKEASGLVDFIAQVFKMNK